MRAVVQRVTGAHVESEGTESGRIGGGLAVLLGVECGDTEKDAADMARKLGCSLELALGLPERSAASQAAGAGWSQGTPEREGWYAVKVGFFTTTVAQPRVFWWTGEEWLRDREKGLPMDRAFNVTGWLALPEE